MERQDRLRPTPMPPEEKQALRAHAKADILNGVKLGFLADLPGAPGDILSLAAKYFPIAAGQSIDALTLGAEKPSKILSEGLGSKFFQQLSNIKPKGGFAESATRILSGVTPIPVSGIVKTLQTADTIARKGSPFELFKYLNLGDNIDPVTGMKMAMADGSPISAGSKLKDVPRTNAEVLMSEASGAGGMKPKSTAININKKSLDPESEVTFGSALSTDKSVYSRLIQDLENVNKQGAVSIPESGVTGKRALEILKNRPTFLEAQESGLVAYLNRNLNENVTPEKMLQVARAYKPNINKRVYSRNELEKMQAENIQRKDGSGILADYQKGIRNYDQQLQKNIELVATDYKNIHFNDPMEVLPKNKFIDNTFMSEKIKGLSNAMTPYSNAGYHDYGESKLNPGYFAHTRLAEVTLDPTLNGGLTNGFIVQEQQMNLAGNKDRNASLESLPIRVQKQEDKIKTMNEDYDNFTNNSIGSFAEKIKQFELRNEKMTIEALELFEKEQNLYRDSGQFKKDLDRKQELFHEIVTEKIKLEKMQKEENRGISNLDGGSYDARRNPKYLNILTNADRVHLDEIAKIDKSSNSGSLINFRSERSALEAESKLAYEQSQILNKKIGDIQDKSDAVTSIALRGETASYALKKKSKSKSDILVSPFSIYDSRGDLAIDPFFEMFVDAKKLGVNENFKIKLARNQLDDKINNIVDYEKKTASMDLGFFQTVKKELKGETTRKDNKNIVDNVMKSEASNYYETQRLTTDLSEIIRSSKAFYEQIDKETITNIKEIISVAGRTGDTELMKKARIDLKNIFSEALTNSGINVKKQAEIKITESIKERGVIPAFSVQLERNPIKHKEQAINDLAEAITKPNVVKIPTKERFKSEEGRSVIQAGTGQYKLKEEDFDSSLNSLDGLDILEARLGGANHENELSHLYEKSDLLEASRKQADIKIEDNYNNDKFIEIAKTLRPKLRKDGITDKTLDDVFMRAMQHEQQVFDRKLEYKPLFKNAPFPNMKKAGQFLTRSNIQQALEDGKEFIAFPSRNDYARARNTSKDGAFAGVFGSSLDQVLAEYVKKGAILTNKTINASNRASISTTVGNEPMRILDLRPLLGKKKEAIPRMNKGGLFEKFRKAS